MQKAYENENNHENEDDLVGLEPITHREVGVYLGFLLLSSGDADFGRLQRLAQYDDLDWVTEMLDILKFTSDDVIFANELGWQEFINRYTTVVTLMDDIMTVQVQEMMFYQIRMVAGEQIQHWSLIHREAKGKDSATRRLRKEAKTMLEAFQGFERRLLEAENTIVLFKEALVRTLFPESIVAECLERFSLAQMLSCPECSLSLAMDIKYRLMASGPYRNETKNQISITSLSDSLLREALGDGTGVEELLAAFSPQEE